MVITLFHYGCIYLDGSMHLLATNVVMKQAILAWVLHFLLRLSMVLQELRFIGMKNKYMMLPWVNVSLVLSVSI